MPYENKVYQDDGWDYVKVDAQHDGFYSDITFAMNCNTMKASVW